MPDAALMRMLKDAVDHGVNAPHKASEEEVEQQKEKYYLVIQAVTH